MCGLIGIAGDMSLKDETTLKRMFLLDYLRGPDSTGLAAVRIDGEIKIAKLPSHPLDLFDQGKFKTALNANISKVFIGHNRAATYGGITQGNSHPFTFEHITGAHNGTLDKDVFRELEKELGESFSVDSQALFASIARFGLKDTISLLRGAWSIVFYDSKDDTLNFIRNKERPMWYGYSKDFKKLFWASEWPMIEAAVRLTGGYELYRDEKTQYDFFETEENVHYAWNVTELKAGGKLPKPKCKTMKGKEAAVVTTVTPFVFREPDKHKDNSSSGTKTDTSSSMKRLTTTIGKNTSKASTAGNETISHYVGSKIRPFAGLVTEEAFHAVTRQGCSYCFEPLEWGTRGMAFYEKDEIVLCHNCSGHPHQNRVYSKYAIYA